MSQYWAELIVYTAFGYSAIGFLLGLAFVSFGVDKVDPSARGAGWGFRLLILPGVAALWPIIVQRWRKAAQGAPIEKTAHRGASR